VSARVGPWYALKTKPDKLARDRGYYYANHEERKRAVLERYHARRKAGLCGGCGKVAPREGKSECQPCADKRSVRKAARTAA